MSKVGFYDVLMFTVSKLKIRKFKFFEKNSRTSTSVLAIRISGPDAETHLMASRLEVCTTWW